MLISYKADPGNHKSSKYTEYRNGYLDTEVKLTVKEPEETLFYLNLASAHNVRKKLHLNTMTEFATIYVSLRKWGGGGGDRGV